MQRAGYLSVRKQRSAGISFCDDEESESNQKMVDKTEDFDEAEDYQKLSKEAKRSILALNKVMKVAKKIHHWCYDSGAAHEVNFNTKNELELKYEAILDTKVSEFLKEFIIDLTAYMDLKMEFLKKRADLLSLTPHKNHFEKANLKRVLRTQRSSVDHKNREFFENSFSSSPRKIAKENLSSSPRKIMNLNQTIANSNELVVTKLNAVYGLSELPLNLTATKSQEEKYVGKERNESIPSLTNEDTEDLSSQNTIKLKTIESIRTIPICSEKSIQITKNSLKSLNDLTLGTQSQTIQSKCTSKKEINSESPFKSPFKGKTFCWSAKSEQALDNKLLNPKQSGTTIDFLKSLHQEENVQLQSFPSLLLEDEPQTEAETNFQTFQWDSPTMRGCFSVNDINKCGMSMTFHDSPNSQIDEFEFIKFLGKGAYGTVWLVKRKVTGDIYAMKIVDWADRFTKNRFLRLKTERDIYEILQGDFVVKAVWAFHHQSFLCFVTEYMVGGDFNTILDEVGRLDENQARFYFAELVLAIESLHNLGIVHRDLKPDNILMDANGHLRLTDFGLSEFGFNKLLSCKSPGKGSVSLSRNSSIGLNRTTSYDDERKDNKTLERSETLTVEIERMVGLSRNHSIEEERKEYRIKERSETLKTEFEKKISKKKSEHIFKFLDHKEILGISNAKETILRKKLDSMDDKRHGIVGTPDYMAPEVIAPSQIEGQSYNEKCIDWWSLGVILYQFLVGIPPFCDDELGKVFDNVLNHRIEWPPIGNGDDCISLEAADLIGKLLDPNPSQRLGAKGAKEVKQHPFFKGFNWKNVRESVCPLVPSSEREITEDSESLSEQLQRIQFPFDLLSGRKDKSTCSSINLGGLELRRLDVLDKLNRDAYKQLQKQIGLE